MSIPTHDVTWISQPLLCTWELNHPPSVTFQDVLTFMENGCVIIGNRSFARSDPIDYRFVNGHAFRNGRSRRLVVRCSGPHPAIYVFEYRSWFYFFHRGWYRMIPRET